MRLEKKRGVLNWKRNGEFLIEKIRGVHNWKGNVAFLKTKGLSSVKHLDEASFLCEYAIFFEKFEDGVIMFTVKKLIYILGRKITWVDTEQ